MLQILLVLCSHKYTVELRRDPATAYRNKQPKSKEKGWPGAKTSQPVSAGSRGNRRRWAALRDEGRLPGRWPCLRCSCSPRLGRAAAFGSGPTALYRHAAFFDRDGDGVVSLAETYGGELFAPHPHPVHYGFMIRPCFPCESHSPLMRSRSPAFRALGFGFSVSSVSAALINGALGSKCRPENATSSKLDIYIEDIQRGKHGSDTGSYDAEGRFVPEKFEEIFAKHARTVPDALTSDEIDQMLEANREPGDYSGWAAAEAEWKILYSLGKDQDGLLRKDVARGVYDGTLFHRLAPDWKSPQKLSVIREN
ncbi:hypothetical protein U9M48_022058 [Paspalum notatum var. saurae]|uniref:Peroxygenase 5 n=1 Tax=Paspalum notatum var. saurae TaxID=547442 RepID=A0AAQ3TGY0_PASNO